MEKFFRGGGGKNHIKGFVLKADIKHYFQTVDHKVLFNIIAKRVKDKEVLWLTKLIIDNYHSNTPEKGMPLGNWTSQFFANVYLNELDQFIKHKLKVRYYLRYVDDFVILHESKDVLKKYKFRIEEFLSSLKLELHPEKSKIIPLSRGICLLGFRVFYHHRLVSRRNLRKIRARIKERIDLYEEGFVSAWHVLEALKSWNGYAMHGNTYKLIERLRRYTEEKMVHMVSERSF